MGAGTVSGPYGDGTRELRVDESEGQGTSYYKHADLTLSRNSTTGETVWTTTAGAIAAHWTAAGA